MLVPDDEDAGTPLALRPLVLDEKTFMQECANRINSFLKSYPREARRSLSQFISYEHELAQLHEEFDAPSGISVGALFAGILQTHHGTGWYLRPNMAHDAKLGKVVVSVEVARQDDEGDQLD